MQTNFEQLQIYQLAERLSDEIWSIVISWERLAKDTLGKQMIRAADSIGANIAEGSGRGSNQEYRHFLRIARGSLYETKHWLRRAHRRQLISAAQIQEIKPIMDELLPKLNVYMRSVGQSIAKEKPKTPRPKT